MSQYFILYPHRLPADLLPRRKAEQPLTEAFGSELAEDICSCEDIPPYDVALRDGWALSSASARIDREDAPVSNGVQPERLSENACCHINTGGFLPIGADAVFASKGEEKPGSGEAVYAGENVLPAGSEWLKGQCLLRAGTVIGASETALLSEAGAQTVTVYRRPSAAILSTGHEIREVGFSDVGARHSSNAYYLLNLLSGLGLRDVCIFYSPDDKDRIADRLAMLRDTFDVIVSVGGTGQGRSDQLRPALEKLGARSVDSGTVLSSSLPYLCSRLGSVPFFGLPGNPLGFINIAQRVVLPLVWNAFRTTPFPFKSENVLMGFDAEAKAGEICVQLAPHGKDLIALAVRKGTGRSSVFRDAQAVIANPEGLRLEAGSCVRAERFFNGFVL